MYDWLQAVVQHPESLQPHFGSDAAKAAVNSIASTFGHESVTIRLRLPDNFIVPSVPESLSSLPQRFFDSLHSGSSGVNGAHLLWLSELPCMSGLTLPCGLFCPCRIVLVFHLRL